MSDKVRYTASFVCEKSGEELEIKGKMDSDIYVISDENQLNNYFLRKLLKRYPSVHLGDIVASSSIATSHATADRKEEWDSTHGIA